MSHAQSGGPWLGCSDTAARPRYPPATSSPRSVFHMPVASQVLSMLPHTLVLVLLGATTALALRPLLNAADMASPGPEGDAAGGGRTAQDCGPFPCLPGQADAMAGLTDTAQCLVAFSQSARECALPAFGAPAAAWAPDAACCAAVRAVGPKCLELRARLMSDALSRSGGVGHAPQLMQ